MKLEKISYGSAVVFGAISLISVFLLGLLGMVSPEVAALMGSATVIPFSGVVFAALAQGVAAYIGIIFIVLVYNVVAKRYPIAWTVSKK